MSETIVASEPITEALQNLPIEKHMTHHCMIDGELKDFVTAEFHDAFMAEMRARWQRDITRLEDIQAILEERP